MFHAEILVREYGEDDRYQVIGPFSGDEDEIRENLERRGDDVIRTFVLTLRNVITGSVTWDRAIGAAVDASGADPDAPATDAQIERGALAALRDGPDGFGPERAAWIAVG